MQGVTPEQLHADGWAIGFDDRFPKKARIQQALLFARFSTHDNLYAHPMVSRSLDVPRYVLNFILAGLHTGHRLARSESHPHRLPPALRLPVVLFVALERAWHRQCTLRTIDRATASRRRWARVGAAHADPAAARGMGLPAGLDGAETGRVV